MTSDGWDDYTAGVATAAAEPVTGRGLVALTGRDAVSFLHGILTNDVAGLAPGAACYAAWLTPQGRMVTDMHVLRTDAGVLLDVEAGVAADVARRIDQSLFSEQLTVVDRSSALPALTVHGPAALEAVARALDTTALPLAHADRLAHATVRSGGDDVLLVTGTWPERASVRLRAPDAVLQLLAARLATAGVPTLAPPALEALRIEAGVPVFGVDMTTDTIPLEAGIESRAISFSKGCYVGQEVIIRILHRGHGRVARRLVGLAVDADTPLTPGTSIVDDGREVGAVTSSAWSPALGRVAALGYVARERAEPGTRLRIADGPEAVVHALPIVSARTDDRRS